MENKTRTILVAELAVEALICETCKAAIYPESIYRAHVRNHEKLQALQAVSGIATICKHCGTEFVMVDSNTKNLANQCPSCRVERIRNAAKKRSKAVKSKQASATGIEYRAEIKNAPNRGSRRA